MKRNRFFRIRSRRHRKGAAVVEFALVLPLLLLLFVVGMDFARLYYFAQVVSDCARQGALYACNPDLADASPYESIEQAIEAAAGDLDTAPEITVLESVDLKGNRYVSVTVSYTAQLTTRFGGIPSRYQLTRTAYARRYPAALVEDQP